MLFRAELSCTSGRCERPPGAERAPENRMRNPELAPSQDGDVSLRAGRCRHSGRGSDSRACPEECRSRLIAGGASGRSCQPVGIRSDRWPPSTLTPEGAIAHQGCLCSVSGSRNPSVPAASRLAVLVRHASDNLAPSQDGEKARPCGARSEGADSHACCAQSPCLDPACPGCTPAGGPMVQQGRGGESPDWLRPRTGMRFRVPRSCEDRDRAGLHSPNSEPGATPAT